MAEFAPSSQVNSTAPQSDSLTLLSQLLTPESNRRIGNASQPEVLDTQDDTGPLTTTSTAGDEAAFHTMDANSPVAPAPSTSTACTGASWDCLRDVMESPGHGKAFHFDSRGDLVLNVGEAFYEGGQEFVVCSRTVARWSKVFNAMFFGGFAESIPSSRDGTWTVALPEDRIAPVFLILVIIHGPYQTIPTVLERDELFDLLIVTEKYGMTHILRPWASKWL
ncbi:nuclear pore protein-like protein [Colletotrichum kahawae]|uniref:Nuclear pore protein-like protein n=1 Tax=Colletotrichum kahawae TaxID=34407 RepID=A0AAD9YNK0_COLKA|nr:nuclear pore protein-like protein [Colletotrichum kahawae]